MVLYISFILAVALQAHSHYWQGKLEDQVRESAYLKYVFETAAHGSSRIMSCLLGSTVFRIRALVPDPPALTVRDGAVSVIGRLRASCRPRGSRLKSRERT